MSLLETLPRAEQLVSAAESRYVESLQQKESRKAKIENYVKEARDQFAADLERKVLLLASELETRHWDTATLRHLYKLTADRKFCWRFDTPYGVHADFKGVQMHVLLYGRQNSGHWCHRVGFEKEESVFFQLQQKLKDKGYYLTDRSGINDDSYINLCLSVKPPAQVNPKWHGLNVM